MLDFLTFFIKKTVNLAQVRETILLHLQLDLILLLLIENEIFQKYIVNNMHL